MSKSIYIASTEPRSGKSLVSLAMVELLKGGISKVAFFRPIISRWEKAEMHPDIHLIIKHHQLKIHHEDTFGLFADQAMELLAENKLGLLIDTILAKVKKLEDTFDFVLIEGLDFSSQTRSFEFDLNSELAKNLGAPVLLVVPGNQKTPEHILASLNLAIESYSHAGCTVIAAMGTRIAESQMNFLRESIHLIKQHETILINFIPENKLLNALTMQEIAQALGAEVLYGTEYLLKHAQELVVAGMRLENFLSQIKEGTLVIVSGDRADIILGGFVCFENKNFPKIMGLVETLRKIPCSISIKEYFKPPILY